MNAPERNTSNPSLIVPAKGPDRLLTMGETMNRTRYSRPSIYRLIKNGSGFPAPIKMAKSGKILFSETAVEAWIATRPRAL
jgi:predicted DNA-binding transcriptional regulator AlpA